MGDKKNSQKIIFNNKFIELLLEEYFTILKRTMETGNKETMPLFIKSIFTGEEYIPDQAYKTTKAEQFVLDLVNVYFELNNSISRLNISYRFAKNIKSNSNQTNEEELSYFFENSLSEMYIFDMRIKKFYHLLESRAQKLKFNEELSEIRRFRNVIREAFKPFLKYRHIHVHEERYESEVLRQLNGMKTFIQVEPLNNIQELQILTKLKYKQAKKHHLDLMKLNLTNITKSCDEMFNELIPIVINRMVIPFHGK